MNEEEEDEFDLDSALDAWAESFDASTSEAPKAADSAAPEVPRPLYQPPSPRRRESDRPTSPPPARRMQERFPSFDEHDDASTQIASIPRDLLPHLSDPDAVDVDLSLDLDELFPEAEDVTSAIERNLPASTAGQSAPPPAAPPDAVDIEIDNLLFDDDEADAHEEVTVARDAPDLVELARQHKAEIEAEKARQARAAQAVPAPTVPKAAVPKPAVPRAAVPKPAVPKPAVQAPIVPKPSVSVSQPPAPLVPPPIAAARRSVPEVARPSRVPPPVVRPPAGALSSKTSSAPPAPSDVDAELDLVFGELASEHPPARESEQPSGAALELEDGPTIDLDDVDLEDGPTVELAETLPRETAAQPAFADDEPQLEIDDEPQLEIADDEPELHFDDDEPQLEIADDEPELHFDDDEPELEVGDAPMDVEAESDSLLLGDGVGIARDSDAPAPAGLDALPEVAPRGDQGAQTAQRTVTRRKPRRETHRLVGHSADVQRTRAKLLKALAAKAEGSQKAGLLLAAAELEMQLGIGDEARTLTQGAREADPTDLVALRSLRREAMARRDWSEAEALLEDELRLPLSPEDRSACAMLLAELRMTQTHDFAAAAEAANIAHEASGSPAAALLLAEARKADGDEEGAAEALGRASDGWNDARANAILRGFAGRALERRGDRAAASKMYSGEDLISCLGRSRSSSLSPIRRDALTSVSERVSNVTLAEVATRGAALLALSSGDADWATDVLETALRPPTHRVRARAAQAAGRPDAQERSLELLAANTGATARALALVDLAEVLAERGDLDGADSVLRDAHLADAQLGTVQVVREVIARRAGDSSRLARAVEDRSSSGRGAVEGAAKLVSSRADEDDAARNAEREQLAHALDEAVAPLTADTILLDLLAESGDAEGTLVQLRRYADRATGLRRVGALLALAERSTDPGAALSEARDSAPGYAPVTRPLARLLRQSNPERAAAAWLEEAEAAESSRAAHAATTAARVLLDSGRIHEAHSAARRAFDGTPGPGPAAWLLGGDLANGLEGEDLAIFLEELGDADPIAQRGAVAHATAALRTGTGHGWARALELSGDDPIAREEMLQSTDVDPRKRAMSLSKLALEAESDTRRMAALRAGQLYEASGAHDEAANLYRSVLNDGDDPIALRFLDRAELAEGSYARVAERRFARVRETAGTDAALAALESLAAVDLYERDDPRSAFLTLQSILEEAPGHIPTLRSIERYFMDQQRDDEIGRIERALAEHLASRADRAAAARAAVDMTLCQPEARGDAADALLIELAEHTLPQGDEPVLEDQRWLAARLLEVRGTPSEIRARAIELTTERRDESERGPLLLTERDALVEHRSAASLAEWLQPAEANGHPILSEARGELLEIAGDALVAAAAFERAARLAGDDEHRLHLYASAARNYQEGDDEAAILRTLEAAAAIDVTHGEVFDSLREIYQRKGDAVKLAALAEKRVAAGADENTLLSLHETQARLKTTLGDPEGAKQALRSALKIEPGRPETLERLARVCLEDEDWAGAAEALVRYARVRQNRDDLRWVFFELGKIYDVHLPDAKRAEAAYRRVLKLAPDDLETLDRLSKFYFRNAMWPQAVIALGELYKREIDPDAKVAHRIQLSRAHEESGKLRLAEQTLEEQRRQDPHDLVVLRAMADLYERQNAQSALNMHLSRAVGDFRRHVEEAPADPEGWLGLADVLGWRGSADAGRAVASAALGAGVSEITLASRLDAEGGIPGGGAAATDVSLHEILAPPLLTPATFEVFRQAGETLDKLMPFDPRAWRAERLDKKSEALRLEAQRIARWFGHADANVLIAHAAPRICVPVSADPLTIVLGRDVAQHATSQEREFLFARAAKVASSQLGVAMRSPPGQLGLYLAGLVRLYDPNHQPPALDPRELDAATKKVARVLPRRIRDILGPAVIEMGGTEGFDAARLGLAAAQLGDRVALLGLGNVPKATIALLRLAGIQGAGQKVDERIASLRQVPEALDLVRFATSDSHFEARRRIGADRT